MPYEKLTLRISTESRLTDRILGRIKNMPNPELFKVDYLFNNIKFVGEHPIVFIYLIYWLYTDDMSSGVVKDTEGQYSIKFKAYEHSSLFIHDPSESTITYVGSDSEKDSDIINKLFAMFVELAKNNGDMSSRFVEDSTPKEE